MTYVITKPDDNLGVITPQEVAAAVALAQSIAKMIGLGKDVKANYKQWDAASLAAIQAYGPDFVSGATALGLDPGAVATEASAYLQGYGVTLTPAQLLADAQKKAGGSGGQVVAALRNNLMPIALGGAGLIGLMIFMHGKR